MSAYQQRFSCSPSLEYGVILTPVYFMAFPSCILFFLPHLSPSDITAYLCDGLPPLQNESYESKELCPFCSQLRAVPGVQSALKKSGKSE